VALSHTTATGGAQAAQKEVEVTRVQTDTARPPALFLPMPPTQIRWHFHFFILNNAIIFLEYSSLWIVNFVNRFFLNFK
jgi:hypothetical protein